jgi:hypothetical protein
MMASVFAGARTFGLGMSAAWTIQVAVALPTLAASIWAVRRTVDPVLRAGVLAAAVPLLTPYVFNYDLTAISAVLIWRFFSRDYLPLPAPVMVLAWLTPTMIMPLQMLGFGGTSLALIALFTVLVREIAQDSALSVQAGIPATV